MTNSAPKMSDKVERQGSPNNGKRQHNRASIKTATYFSSSPSGARNNNPNINNNNNVNNNNNNNSNNNSNNNNINSTTRNANGRRSCSPPLNLKNTRNSPLRNNNNNNNETSPRGSPTGSFYAGAKFSEPPSPASLPKPPSHWTTRLMTSCKQSETCCNISNHLKMILNVQA